MEPAQKETVKKNISQNFFPDRINLNIKLADRIAGILSASIKERGHACMAVSGGSTPVPLFTELAARDVMWNKVFITLVDERWVDRDSSDSNEKMVRTNLLQQKATEANFTGLKNSAATAVAGETECEQKLKELPLPFDVLILGMGEDGHTASLFPGSKKLKEATAMHSGRTCMAITPVNAHHERITLTLPAILSASQIFIHITGTKKKEILEKAQLEEWKEEYPISLILKQNKTAAAVYWAE